MQDKQPTAQPTLPDQTARVHPVRRAALHRLGADAAAVHADSTPAYGERADAHRSYRCDFALANGRRHGQRAQCGRQQSGCPRGLSLD